MCRQDGDLLSEASTILLRWNTGEFPTCLLQTRKSFAKHVRVETARVPFSVHPYSRKILTLPKLAELHLHIFKGVCTLFSIHVHAWARACVVCVCICACVYTCYGIPVRIKEQVLGGNFLLPPVRSVGEIQVIRPV